MSKIEGLLSTVTNPVILLLFNKGWEDPGWGQTPMGQVVISTVIYDLANQMSDIEVQKEIKTIAAKSIMNAGEKLMA